MKITSDVVVVMSCMQVTSESPVGTTDSRSTTVVMLVSSNHSSDGLLTVITELQLVASASYPMSRLGCRANGVRIRTVTFSTSLLPGNTHIDLFFLFRL